MKKEKISEEKRNTLIKSLNMIYIKWLLNNAACENDTCGEEKITKNRNFIIEHNFLSKIIVNKLDWAGIDIIVPDELLIIISTCADTPAEVQMMLTDIFDGILKRYDRIPKKYIVKPSDFNYVFPKRYPLTYIYDDMKEEYNNKWEMQKIKSNKYHTDNMYDTKEFWERYK